ncbi:hypothetical protein EVAR_66791_1 [Eumeta japonica]|uniref:Uncharacterized protein n=1 Tax=Eumeta variegata TaxID=151549 RepID=A0A4C2A0A8_EUMVA|nr:hypothetical protein EVAR_66791_1 [Eumeta japonica]
MDVVYALKRQGRTSTGSAVKRPGPRRIYESTSLSRLASPRSRIRWKPPFRATKHSLIYNDFSLRHCLSSLPLDGLESCNNVDEKRSVGREALITVYPTVREVVDSGASRFAYLAFVRICIRRVPFVCENNNCTFTILVGCSSRQSSHPKHRRRRPRRRGEETEGYRGRWRRRCRQEAEGETDASEDFRDGQQRDQGAEGAQRRRVRARPVRSSSSLSHLPVRKVLRRRRRRRWSGGVAVARKGAKRAGSVPVLRRFVESRRRRQAPPPRSSLPEPRRARGKAAAAAGSPTKSKAPTPKRRRPPPPPRPQRLPPPPPRRRSLAASAAAKAAASEYGVAPKAKKTAKPPTKTESLKPKKAATPKAKPAAAKKAAEEVI